MARTNGQTSVGPKARLLIGISFPAGVALGVLAVIAIQILWPQNEHSTQDVAQHVALQPGTNDTSRNSTAGTVVTAKFEEVFKHQRIFDQNKALHDELAQASEDDLKDWWTQSEKVERQSHREFVQDVIVRKLATINPRHALRCIETVSKFQTDVLLRSVFVEWSALQLDDAVEAATTLSVHERNIALKAILETRDDLSDDELRSIAKQLNGEQTLLLLVSEAKASISIAKPMESWNLLLHDDIDDSLQTEFLAVVATAWLEQVGFEVLSKIASDIEDFWDRQQLIEMIVQEDPANALEYALGISQHEPSELSSMVVRAWARTDALAALAAVNSLEQNSANASLERDIASVWAQTKPDELIENIEKISEDHRLQALESSFSKIARRDPLAAFAKMSSVENFVVNTSSIEQWIVMFGSEKNPHATTDWVIREYVHDDPQRQRLLGYALLSLARQDPEHAFELALAQPTPEGEEGLETRVMWTIAREGDIELAKKLLPRVKAGSKLRSYMAVGEAMAKNLQTDEAFELGNDVEESRRRIYHQRVLNSWASTHPKNLYESLESLPSSYLKSQAARELIQQNEFKPIFTEEQIDRVKTHLDFDNEARM